MKNIRIGLILSLLMGLIISCSVNKQPSDKLDTFTLSLSDSTNLTCVAVASGSSKTEALILALSNFAKELESKVQKNTEMIETLDKYEQAHKEVLFRSFNNLTIKSLTKSFYEEGSSVNYKYFESVYKLTYFVDDKSMIIKFSTTDSSGDKYTSRMDISSRNASFQDMIQNLDAFGINTKIKAETSGFYIMLSSKKEINDLISRSSIDSDSLNDALKTIESELAKDSKVNDKEINQTDAFKNLEREIEKFEEFKNK